MYITSNKYGFDPEFSPDWEDFQFEYNLNEKEYSLILFDYGSYHEKITKDLDNEIDKLGIDDPYNEFKKKVNQLISKGV